MFPRLPRLFPRRQRALWLMLCSALTLLIAITQIRNGRGATPDLLPLPVNLAMPAEVLASDNFGAAMAMDGDIVAVGAPNRTVNDNTKQGVVYLYQRDGSDPTAFTLLKSITGSDSVANDSFGSSVAIHGDTLVVGSYRNAAYVFERNQGGANQWGSVKKLERGDNRSQTHFGRSLAIHDDTILVGAPLGLGEVFVFRRDQDGAGQWGKTQLLDSGLPLTSSLKVASFGEIIAFDGETLAINAPGYGLRQGDVQAGTPPLPQNFFGAVFVYRQENGQWQRDAKLFSSDIDPTLDPPIDDLFGRSLAINGGVLFVGAPDGSVNNSTPGKVLVYQKGEGTEPRFGEPGAWGEIAQLSPSDSSGVDDFGAALYAVDDGLFAGAPNKGLGKVYFFRNPAGAVAAAAPNSSPDSSPHTSPYSLQQWGEIYSFSNKSDGSPTPFGNPLAGGGNTLLVGAHPRSGGSSDIYAYAKEALFAHDPNSTPVPTATPAKTPPPDDVKPCVWESIAQQRQLFLPTVAGGTTQGTMLDGTDSAVVFDAPPLISGILAPGCLLSSPNGLRIAAVQGAITQSIAISIETIAAPAKALPDGTTPLGNFLRFSANRNEATQMESPFVIAIPVPQDADPKHLVITHLVAPTDTLDSEATGEQWGFIPGTYDAATRLFLARMPFVQAQGTTLVLLQHPDFESATNQPTGGAQSAAVNFGGFRAYCIYNTFNSRNHCTGVMEATVEGFLDDIYARMTDSHIFNYPKRLRLLDSSSQFIVSNYISVTDENLTYAVYLMGPKDDDCDGYAGYYTPKSGFLALCVGSSGSLNAATKGVLIHEFFHAVENTYRKVFGDYDLWHREQAWVIEGMAEAAKGSFPDTQMQRATYYGENALKFVDEQLTDEGQGQDNVTEYLAQDFWVYAGLSEGQSLAYLGPVLQLGGANQTGIDKALRTLYGKSLGEFYWGWVKHQSIENTYDVGSGPGVKCELTEEALSTGQPIEFPSAEQVYPFDTQSDFDHLQPLTAKVIQIDFGQKISAQIHVGYERCNGLTDDTALATCLAVAQSEIKAKVYVEGEHNCHKDELPGVNGEGRRSLINISPDLRYFIVVANIDLDEEHGYYIAIE